MAENTPHGTTSGTDSPSTGSDGDDGGGSAGRTRRGFLAAAAGSAALGAGLGVSPAAARTTCTGESYEVGADGEFTLINNDWGYTDNRQCIFDDDDGSYGWEWDRGSTGDGDPNYPEVLLGTKPWGIDSGAPQFPVRLGDVDEMDLSLDISNGASPPEGNWDLALEWWLTTNRPGGGADVGESITHEIMTVIEWGDGHGHGTPVETNATQDAHGNTIDYWARWDIGWSFHIFRIAANSVPSELDLHAIVEYLSTQVSDPYGRPITDDHWVSGIEIGNEYWDDTSGTTTVWNFDATVNGETSWSGYGDG